MTWYRLWINGPAGTKIYDKWYTAAEAGCSSGTGTCSVTPNITLGGGNHTWWIQTWNEAGDGPWSPGKTFSTTVIPPAGKATLISPNGNIANNNPTYTWNQVSGATWYYLWVDGPSGNVLKKWYTSVDANCNGSTCSVAGATPGLSPGTHTWWIQTWSNAGDGPWSDAKTFSTPSPWPRQPTLVGPNASTTDLTPTYTWNAVSSDTGNPATSYYLWVDGPNGNVIKTWYLASQAGCASGTGTCSITPNVTLLPGGTYTWWIQAWNTGGYSLWSNSMSFSIPSTGGFNSQFNGSSSGWTPYYGSWSIANNQWYFAPGDGEFYVSSGYSAENYGDFDLQARVATTKPHEAYLLVRGTPLPLDEGKDWNSSYSFGFDVNGFYTVGKVVNGEWTVLQPWTPTTNYNLGGNWNILRVVASGSNLSYYNNGTLVWSGVDNSLTSGQIGFELGTNPEYGLWVDWITLNSDAENMLVVTETVSPEQQALNDAAKVNGSDKVEGRNHQP
jgi:hypothetical protein